MRKSTFNLFFLLKGYERMLKCLFKLMIYNKLCCVYVMQHVFYSVHNVFRSVHKIYKIECERMLMQTYCGYNEQVIL